MRELKTDQGKALANYIIECHQKQQRPPLLWLGAGTSVSAGFPTTNKLLENITENLGIDIKTFDDLDSTVIDKHKELILRNRLSTPTENSFGYSLLAELILRDYFRIILTTNWDSVLENELHRVVPAGQINVLTREQHSDEFIAEQLKNDDDSIILLRLHGDLKGRLITTTESLLNFEGSLEAELERKIQSDGLIFLGYGLQESNLTRLVRVNKKVRPKIWVVDPAPGKNSLIATLGIDSNQVISSDEALFDNFLQGICYYIMQRRFSGRHLTAASRKDRKYREKVDSLVDGIVTRLKENILDEDQIEEFTKDVLKKIRSYSDSKNGKVALLYLSDVDSPGGDEVYELVNRKGDLNKLVEDIDAFTVHIVGRREKDVRRLMTFDPPNFDLTQYEAVILFDDASFSGNTLLMIRKQLEDLFTGAEPDFVAALLCINQELKYQLENSGWKVINARLHTGFGLMCPWGFTRPSQLLITCTDGVSPEHQPPELAVDSFISSSNTSYIPKPWGELILFRENTNNSSRIIFLERGQRTSLHYHLLRDEILFVLDSRVRIRFWDRYIELNKNQSVRVPAGVPHSIIALESSVSILEIAEGYYDAKRDIVRLKDVYNRSKDILDSGIEADNGLI